MKLPPQLEKLSQIKHAKIIGLLITVLLGLALIIAIMSIGSQFGYSVMMFGLVIITFAVPYLFGWRDGKKLAVAGIGIFLLVGAISGPLGLYFTYNAEQPEPVESAYLDAWFTKSRTALNESTYTTPAAWYRLENGTVEPYQNEVGLEYTFRVTLYSNATESPDVRVGYLRDIWGMEGDKYYMSEVETSDTNYLDGKDYYFVMAGDNPGIYFHWFSVVFGSGSEAYSLNTTMALGPLVGSQADNWGTYIPMGAVTMFCNIGLLFLIIVLLYWWLGTAKAKRKVWDEALREKEEEADEKDGKATDDALEFKPFSCDQCGAPVGVDDNFCPKCGERFDGVDDDAREDGDNSKADGKAEEEGS
ncbi:MAG: zinc ribbon domain-containing protein [Thermoplasmata archaeon]